MGLPQPYATAAIAIDMPTKDSGYLMDQWWMPQD
jgi:hypothetical protein